MAELKSAKRHKISIDNRENLSASGVLTVDFFSEELITARTEIGQLNIKGKSLHIESLSAETGDMYVTGHIIALSYSESTASGSFLSRIFK